MSVSGVKRVSCYHVTTEVAMRYAGDATKGNQAATVLAMGDMKRCGKPNVALHLFIGPSYYTVNNPTPPSWESALGEACTTVPCQYTPLYSRQALP